MPTRTNSLYGGCKLRPPLTSPILSRRQEHRVPSELNPDLRKPHFPVLTCAQWCFPCWMWLIGSLFLCISPFKMDPCVSADWRGNAFYNDTITKQSGAGSPAWGGRFFLFHLVTVYTYTYVHICAQKHKHTNGYSFTKRIWSHQTVQRHWLFICKLPEVLELQVCDSIPGICILFCFLRQGRSVAQAGMENKLAFASVNGDMNTAQGRDFSPRPTARLSKSVRI